MTNRERDPGTPTRTPARDRILDVADRLFYEQGIHAVGVDTVVAESQVAKTTLYSHFRSKDELIAAYLRRRSERWLVFVDDQLASHGGAPAFGSSTCSATGSPSRVTAAARSSTRAPSSPPTTRPRR